ncbi:MAG: putative DNA binding domain-containing protein [Caldilineaceae bacterium]
MMSLEEVRQKLHAGEDSYTEFKERLDNSESVAGEIVAFANTDGGRLFVGVTDSGAVIGVADPPRVERQLAQICRENILPPLIPLIETVTIDGQIILELEVRGVHKPYRTKGGRYYVRVGSTKQDASPQELLRLAQRAGAYRYDEAPVPGTSEADLDWTLFARYYRAVTGEDVTTSELSAIETLRGAFILTEYGGKLCLTVAALLCFGKNPQRYLYQSRLSALRFVGDDVSETMADTQELLGPLPQLIDGAVSFALRNAATKAVIAGTREIETPQYPQAALRELIVNAVAHRDYSLEGAQIRLIMFDHRLELYSPGRLPNGMTLAHLRYYNHVARNPLIVQYLSRLGYMRDFGTGIPRVIRLMGEHNGTAPDFTLIGEEFVARLHSPAQETATSTK